MNTSPPLFSVIVVTHQSQRDIASCLQSLSYASFHANMEIILVDAGSTDKTLEEAHAAGVPHRLLRLRNVGFSACANAGAAVAQGQFLFFLNPDTIVPVSLFRELENEFYSSGCDVVGALLTDERGNPERWQGVSLPSVRNIFHHHLFSQRSLQSSEMQSLDVPWVSGGALAIRRNVFEAIRGFQERFFLYFEDVDLCVRVRAHGGRVCLAPFARIQHRRGQSASQRVRQRAYDDSQQHYFFLHRPRWESLTLRFLRPFFRQRGVIIGSVFAALYGYIWSTEGTVLLVFPAVLVVVVLALRWPSIALGILLLTVLIGQSVRVPVLGRTLTLTDLLLPIIVTGFFLRAFSERERRKIFLKKSWVFIWLGIALLPGLFLAVERLPLTDLLTAGLYAVRLFEAVLLGVLVMSIRIRSHFVHHGILTVSVLLAGIGLFQYFTVPSTILSSDNVFSAFLLSFAGTGWDPHPGRLFSTWLDPNLLGGFLVLSSAVLFDSLHRASQEKKPKRLLLLFLLGTLFVLVLLLTKSRAALLSFLAIAIWFSFLSQSRRLLFVLAVLGVIFLLLVPSPFERFLHSPESDPTVQLRLQSWSQAFDRVVQYPWFGTGYNAYGVEQLLSGTVADFSLHSLFAADNAFLTFLATTGVWGFSLLVLLGIVLSFHLWRLRRRTDIGVMAAFLAVVGLLIHTQFLQSLTYIHLLVPLALLLGVTAVSSSSSYVPPP